MKPRQAASRESHDETQICFWCGWALLIGGELLRAGLIDKRDPTLLSSKHG